MSIYYKIIFLWHKGGFTPEEIAMILEVDIRRSDLCRSTVLGSNTVIPAATFVRNVISTELEENKTQASIQYFENIKAKTA